MKINCIGCFPMNKKEITSSNGWARGAKSLLILKILKIMSMK